MSKTLIKKLAKVEAELWEIGRELEQRIDDGKYKDNYFNAEIALRNTAGAIAELKLAQYELEVR